LNKLLNNNNYQNINNNSINKYTDQNTITNKNPL